jgi:opacity protein-like surface antigen
MILAAVLMAGAASAEADKSEVSGWYAGVQLAAVLTGDLVDEEGTFYLNDVPYDYARSLSTDPGFGAGGFVGYKIPFGFRFEFELSYRRNSLDEYYRFSEFLGRDDRVSLDGHVSALSYMPNVWYDFDLGRGWMPYLGIGLGAATKFIDCGSSACDSVDLERDGETQFAYQIGAGVAYALNPKTVISLDYRYFDSIEADFIFLDYDFDYANHNVVMGIRRHF